MENTEFTKALLEWKADPNARVENNEPIIHEAVLGTQAEQIKLLARAGADLNVVWGDTVVRLNWLNGLDGGGYFA
jgi:ankyrin repeat protein